MIEVQRYMDFSEDIIASAIPLYELRVLSLSWLSALMMVMHTFHTSQISTQI
jgi:hypothetical protein